MRRLIPNILPFFFYLFLSFLITLLYFTFLASRFQSGHSSPLLAPCVNAALLCTVPDPDSLNTTTALCTLHSAQLHTATLKPTRQRLPCQSLTAVALRASRFQIQKHRPDLIGGVHADNTKKGTRILPFSLTSRHAAYEDSEGNLLE